MMKKPPDILEIPEWFNKSFPKNINFPDKNKYVSRQKVLETLNIHYNTLYNMTKKKEIEYITMGRKNLYNLDDYIMKHKTYDNKKISVKKRIKTYMIQPSMITQVNKPHVFSELHQLKNYHKVFFLSSNQKIFNI